MAETEFIPMRNRLRHGLARCSDVGMGPEGLNRLVRGSPQIENSDSTSLIVGLRNTNLFRTTHLRSRIQVGDTEHGRAQVRRVKLQARNWYYRTPPKWLWETVIEMSNFGCEQSRLGARVPPMSLCAPRSTPPSTGSCMRKKYHSPELRREAIRQVVEYRQPAKAVAEQLHLGQDTVRVWVRRHREEKTASYANAAGGLDRASAAAERELLKRMIEMHLLRKAG